MPTQDQIRALIGAAEDNDAYEVAGRALGISPGLAYLVATGLPADGGGGSTPEGRERAGIVRGSTQQLAHQARVVAQPDSDPEVHEWIRRRAHGDAPMREAARDRSVEPGGVEDEDETEISTVLTRQHDQVTALFNELRMIPGATNDGSAEQRARRAAIVSAIAATMSLHEAAEEQELWPAVRAGLPGGEALADTAVGQERKAQEVLTELGHCSGDEDRFDELAERCDAVIRKHVAFEDRVLLALGDTMGEDDRRTLGRRILDAERHGVRRR